MSEPITNPRKSTQPPMRWWIGLIVYTLAVGFIVIAAKICFGRSLDGSPAQPHIHIGAAYWRNIYRRGWPFEFRSWSENGWMTFSEDFSWRPWALSADVVVFLVLATLAMWLASRCVRNPRWSIGAAVVCLSLVCMGLAWYSNTRHRSVVERRLWKQLYHANNSSNAQYEDPVWFARLVGRQGGGDELFFRLSDSDALQPFEEDNEQLLALVAQRPPLRSLQLVGPWKEEDVARLWQLPSLSGLEELNLTQMDLGDEALDGIENCHHLELVDMRLASLGDGAIERLAACQSLRTLYAMRTKITPACIESLQKIGEHAGIDVSATAIPRELQLSFRRPEPPRGSFFFAEDE